MRRAFLPTVALAVAALFAAGTGTAQAAAAPAATGSLNCVNAYLGVNNGQPFYHVQCGVIGQATWYANVACSDGSFHNAGPFTNFREVYVYCPAGTEVQRGWVTSS